MRPRLTYSSWVICLAGISVFSCQHTGKQAVEGGYTPVQDTLQSISGKGATIYREDCERCHGADLKGRNNRDIPDLNGIVIRRSTEEIMNKIKYDHQKRYRMNTLTNKEVNAVVDYITGYQ